MPRATEHEVKEIIETDLTPEEVTPFLGSANALVTDMLSDESYTEPKLRQIELWLAAHFVAIRDPRVSKEKYGEGQQDYQGKTAMGLDATLYGQQAMLFDTNGVLKSIDKVGISPTVEVIRYES